MKIILTNDDGIDAPGLEALGRVVETFAEAVVVAPAAALSGIGHQVTTRTPIPVTHVEEHRIRVEGTPADCARIALKRIAPEAEWLIAGINPGANLGSDVYQSGTVAAAREAAILGRKSMAVSQYISREGKIDWDLTAFHAGQLIRMLVKKDLPPGHYWNINLPHPLRGDEALEARFCPLDSNPHLYDYRIDGDRYIYEGTIHERPRDPHRDVAVCFGGRASITRLGI